jgi:hypothetical protein
VLVACVMSLHHYTHLASDVSVYHDVHDTVARNHLSNATNAVYSGTGSYVCVTFQA